MINATIGRYHIIEELGRGGMGVVYHGHDPLLDRPAAIKILSQALTGNPEAKERFLREAQAAARLNHPNITAIYDISEHEGIYYLVFEFINGTNLDDLLEKQPGPMDVAKALEIFIPLAHALDYAHQHGIVHRDVKPGNVMVTDEGKVKVADFGIAWVEMSQTLTQPGQMNRRVERRWTAGPISIPWVFSCTRCWRAGFPISPTICPR
jgi:serine/threonine protein kinase